MASRCTLVLVLFFVFTSALAAENPVAYIMELSGTWTAAGPDGASRSLEFRGPIYNGTVVKRSSPSGYLKLIDRNGRVTPNLVEAQMTFRGRPEMDSTTQKVVLNFIGGTLARSGKGASKNDFLDWMMDIGSIKEQDVESGAMKLVFSPRTSSFSSKVFLPLTMQVNSQFQIQTITYKVIQSTLVRAEGTLTRRGENWELPLKEVVYEPDQTVPLTLVFQLVNRSTGQEKQFVLQAPYTVLADDGFLESEVRSTLLSITHGADDPDEVALERMARFAVYSDYNLSLYALALWTQQ